MIRLHLLGFTPDLKGLVFSGRRGGRSGTYWVPVDDMFLKALQQLDDARQEKAAENKRPKKGGKTQKATDTLEILLPSEEPGVIDTQDLPLPSRTPPVESRLTPREVQQLLREGRSVKDVAGLAGVDESWVERFMGPVLEEKAGVVRMTQEAFQTRPRLGPSGLPIGDAVLRNLQARKATADTLDEARENWEAKRTRSRTWRVRLSVRHRGKRRSAEWEFTKDAAGVHPRNKLANELGWWPESSGRAARPAVMAEAEPADAEAKPAKRRSGARKVAKRSSAKKRTTTKRKTTSKKRAAPKRKTTGKKRSTRKPAAKKKSAAKRKPASKRKSAAKRKPASKRKSAAKRKPAAKKKSATRKKPVAKGKARKPSAKKKPVRRKKR